MDFVDPELEKFYVFCKVFYKYLPYTKETLPMEILDKIDLDKLRIQLKFDGQLELEDEQQQMTSSRIGKPGQTHEDEKKTIAEILDIANSPFQDLLNENDKILKQIWIDILQDPDVTDAFAAGNSYDALIALVKEKFDEKVADQIEKYYNFQEELEKNQSFSMMLIRKFVEALAVRSRKAINLPYVESELKDAIIASLGQEFVDVCSHMRSFEEFVDVFFEVLNRSSVPSLDGADGIIKNALNNIYCNDHLQSFDKQTYFNSLLSKYESYLKKLYYLCHGEEVSTYTGSTDNSTLANAIHGFACLWNLKYATTEEGRRFSRYLDMVRQWRNDEAHRAPITTDEEVNVAIKILLAMYLFVTGSSITDLEMQEGISESAEDKATKVVPYITHLPFYPTLKAACHTFDEVEHVDTTYQGATLDDDVDWIDVSNEFSHLNKSMFIVRAMGDSMTPKINDGDLCVFTCDVAGSHEGDIVLAELDRIYAGEDSACIIKKYHSEKVTTEDSWEHSSIELIPLNSDYDTIKVEIGNEPRIIGVLKKVIWK